MRSLFIALTILLSACAIIAPPKYHEAEYSYYIEIAAQTSESTCTVEERRRLVQLANRAARYSANLPNNELIASGGVNLWESLLELNQAQSVTPTFCQLKLRIVREIATTLAQTAGGKPQ